MSKESVLKKNFQEKDVQRLRNLVQGKYGEKTRSSVGFSQKEEFHYEGDIWEAEGRTWTIKEGIRQNITKFDKAKLFPLLKCRTFSHIPLDSSCQSPGDLTHHQGISFRIAENQRSALVFGTRLGMPSHKVFARVVLEIIHCSLNWGSIHMHIEWRHKNGYLSAVFFEVFVLYCLFNHYHFSVCRGKNNPLLLRRLEDWISKKLKNDQVKENAYP